MKRPPVVFHRIEDIGEESPSDVVLMECFEEAQIPCILSVIPMSLCTAMASRIRRSQYCEVFQHGYSHSNNVGIGYPDEFPTMYGPGPIRARLMDGRARIEDMIGRRVLGYTPPWNTTSQSTIVLLEELGFSYLSGHRRYEYFTLLRELNVSIDPISSHEPLTLQSIEDVSRELQAHCVPKAEIGVVYHPKRFPMSYLSEIAALVGSVKSLSTLRVSGPTLRPSKE